MYRRLTLAVVTQCLATVVIIVGSLVFSASIGVAGVGWAYLAAETLTAVILAGPLISCSADSRTAPSGSGGWRRRA